MSTGIDLRAFYREISIVATRQNNQHGKVCKLIENSALADLTNLTRHPIVGLRDGRMSAPLVNTAT